MTTISQKVYKKFHKKEFDQLEKTFDKEAYLKEYNDVKDAGIDPFFHYLKYGKNENRKYFLKKLSSLKSKRIDILSTKHTEYVAHLLLNCLHANKIKSEIHEISFEDYNDETAYIIICPQFVKKFPTMYIVFQMEQIAVSSRWFDDRYLDILNNSYAILDYSTKNIEFLNKYENLRSKIFYVPIDCDINLENNKMDYKYDVCFYGDPTSERRLKALKILEEKGIHVKILSEIYGSELEEELSKALIIVNIHYYPNSLLETTRIGQSLSLGNSLIISEHSIDEIEDNRFKDVIEYVDDGDFEQLSEKLLYWLDHKVDLRKKIKINREKLCKRKVNATSFFVGRFLLAQELITFDFFYSNFNEYISFTTDKICLTLPETPERFNAFQKRNDYGFIFFPGLKHTEGWRGCAMSYKFIFKKLLSQNYKKVMVCEDDCKFPADFRDRIPVILEFLNHQDKWDLFSGLMADINDEYFVRRKYIYNHEIIAQLNKTVSMVFCIYNEPIFKCIADYDINDDDVVTNTIDRYLEQKNISVYCAWPFLVKQDDKLESVLWGNKNGDRYGEMILRSQNKLKELLLDYSILYLEKR